MSVPVPSNEPVASNESPTCSVTNVEIPSEVNRPLASTDPSRRYEIGVDVESRTHSVSFSGIGEVSLSMQSSTLEFEIQDATSVPFPFQVPLLV